MIQGHVGHAHVGLQNISRKDEEKQVGLKRQIGHKK
jgi:hypothetical protein